jgi:hypothetical protein
MATAKLETRLGRLEAASLGYGGGDGFPPCPDCGWPRDGNPGPDDTYELVFSDELEGPTFCETCGEPIPEIVVTWGEAG